MTPEELARAQARNLRWLVTVVIGQITIAVGVLSTIIILAN